MHGSRQTKGFTTPRTMGQPTVSLTSALAIADQLEDEEIARRLATGP